MDNGSSESILATVSEESEPELNTSEELAPEGSENETGVSSLSHETENQEAIATSAGATGASNLLLVLKFFIFNEFKVFIPAQSDTKLAVE